jgi:two-component system response regulator YesN
MPLIRVMIVDDDKLARMGFKTMLPWKKHNMEVVGEAANGMKALEILDTLPVDLIFVDLAMPVMPGIDLIRAVRAKYPAVQFVVLTFHEDFKYIQTTMRLGALDYISKIELENADYDAICMRLVQKMAGAVASGPEPASAEPSSPPAWLDAMYSLHWLYDHEALVSLISDMKESPVPLFELEHYLIRTVVKLETLTGFFGITVPSFKTEQEVLSFLSALRGKILLRAHKSDDLSKLAICILKVVYRVANHLNGNLHTDSIAAEVGLSRPYFSSCFTKEVGLSFHAYVRRERVHAAVKMLLETEETIASISEKVGYEDVRSFSKLFQEMMGKSPASYRLHGE